jgi:hypothetical protein
MKRLNIILILAVVILAAIVWRQSKTAQLVEDRSTFVQDSLRNERELLNDSLIILTNELDSVKKATDSIQIAFDKSKSDNKKLAAENRKLKDSLLNIPNDSIYIVMQKINPAEYRKEYGFDGPQIRFWYSSYIDSHLNYIAFKSAENSLNLCDNLVSGLRTENNLLTSQNGNLGKQLILSDMQSELYQNKTVSLQRDNKKLNTEKRIWQVVSGIFGIVAIIK